MAIDWRLSPDELLITGMVGLRRHIFALTENVKPGKAAEDNSDAVAFEHHTLSSMAEYCCSMEFNRAWPFNIGRFDQPDVGGLIEVRARRWIKAGSGLDLCIKRKDLQKPRMPYVQVWCKIPMFKIVGWCYPDEVQALGGVYDPIGDRWFVPYGRLHDPETLRDKIKEVLISR